ncbi:MAG: altronate dehydratase family protein, partial [Balneolaceae bacterium]|nr:altronate dehydratase family protein [Balneolaceae bacterium]
MARRILKIDPDDNLVVALSDLESGQTVAGNGERITLKDDVPAKHKVVTEQLDTGDKVYMYGVQVGTATRPIREGGLVTTDNIRHSTEAYACRSEKVAWNPPDVERWKSRQFMGYHRSDGQVGTANYWLVIPLVFCENRNVRMLEQAFMQELGYSKRNRYEQYVSELKSLYREGRIEQIKSHDGFSGQDIPAAGTRLFDNVDGIKFLTHEGGCGGTPEDAEALCGLLAGYIIHPNVAGATVFSLGCQNAQVEILKQQLAERNPNLERPVYLFEQQQYGTESRLMSEAIRQTFLGLLQADKQKRAPASLDKLTVGLECGGSDGFSGISANPAVGHASDLLVALGGTTILAEFPELCGVEQEIVDRCVSETDADRFVELMDRYSRAAERTGARLDMNPSAGNIKDGLITDAIKSAGAAKKGGTSPITDVLDYPEYVRKSGLNLLCTPGNDIESTTAMAGAGANIILFTTGMGTPTGNPVTPVV